MNYPDANTIIKSSGSLTKTFSSDDRGNLVSIFNNQQEIFNFQYDVDSNMIGAEVNGTNWTFRYNTDNQLYYSKIETGDSTLDERFYIYDGLDCIAETDTAGTILREYIRNSPFSKGGQGDFVDGIVAEIRHNDTTCVPGYESGTFYYHYNHRGDVIAVTKSDGTIVFKADYDAYGKQFTANSLPLTDFKPRYTFSTKRYFSELGLYHYGFRWYLPELGRWTTKDRIGYKGGTYNLYMFCANTVLTVVDPCGLSGTILIHANRQSNMSGTLWGHAYIEFLRDGNIESKTYGTVIGKGIVNGAASSYINGSFRSVIGDATRSMHINDEQEKRMFSEIGDRATKGTLLTRDMGGYIHVWSFTSPCSDFAADVWEAATGENLQDRHLWGIGLSDPSVLADSIEAANANSKCK